MDAEIIKMMYTYNDWANMQIMETAAKLSDGDYRKDFGQAWGSVHGTLAHLCDADMIWFARWHDGESPQHPPDGKQYTTFKMVRDAWEPLMSRRRAWLEKLTGEEIARALVYKNTKGQEFSHPLWWQLLHVANHGTDHRSHLSIMLTELGQQPPALDFIQFVRL